MALEHRDNTALPAEEGSSSCTGGCTEEVTRLQAGARMSGRFEELTAFNVQGARTGEAGAGTLVVDACGQEVGRFSMVGAGAGLPGFNNYPAPAWTVPAPGSCEWSIRAEDGFVDVRAVTTYCPAPKVPPTVVFTINNSTGPLTVMHGETLALSWTSPAATSCTAANAWTGPLQTAGQQNRVASELGTRKYSITCTNALGSASADVTVEVVSAPG